MLEKNLGPKNDNNRKWTCFGLVDRDKRRWFKVNKMGTIEFSFFFGYEREKLDQMIC